MTIKKVLLSMACCLLVVGWNTGCNDKQTPDDESSETDIQEPSPDEKPIEDDYTSTSPIPDDKAPGDKEDDGTRATKDLRICIDVYNGLSNIPIGFVAVRHRLKHFRRSKS